MLNLKIILMVIPYIIEINSYICKFNLGFVSVDLTITLLMTKSICWIDR